MSPEIAVGTRFHCHFPIDYLINASDAELMGMLTHPGGAAGARKALREMLSEGQIYLVVGDCDNKRPDGQCDGHTDKEI